MGSSHSQSEYYDHQRIREAREREHQYKMAEQEQASLRARREYEDNMRREEAAREQARRDHEYRMQQSAAAYASQQAANAHQQAMAVSLVHLILLRRRHHMASYH